MAQNSDRRCRIDWYDLRWVPLTSFYEYGDEHAGYVDGEKLRDQLRNFRRHKSDPAPVSHLISNMTDNLQITYLKISANSTAFMWN